MGRRLGQHFLNRKSILEKIAAAACGEAADWVIEIGPGRGALTECLLERAAQVTAIEIDPVLVLYLRQKFRDAIESGRLVLIEGDILKTDVPALLEGRHPAITGNLPYYITSPILLMVFSLDSQWERAVFLMQTEVAARVAAPPGGSDYGFLSVLAQLYSRPEILFQVERAAFRPPPKVDSAVIKLEPRDGASANLSDGGSDSDGISDKAAFLKFASACFRHKRKTLRNNLAALYGRGRVDAVMNTAAESRLRAEQLSVAELAALHRRLEHGPEAA